MATFTYQLVYWAWVKLETDEVKEGKSCEWYFNDKTLQADESVHKLGCCSNIGGLC